MALDYVGWNMTIPHSSPMINFMGFKPDCPLGQSDILQCDALGSKMTLDSSANEASLTLSFYGSAIYLYGDIGAGVNYSSTIGTSISAKAGQPSGKLLAKYENLRTEYEFIGSTWDRRQHHTVTLNLTSMNQAVALGGFNFSHAVVTLESGSSSAHPLVTSYQTTDSGIDDALTGDWTTVTSGEFWRVSTDSSEPSSFHFDGNGVLVYGRCTNTMASSSYLGRVVLDDVTVDQPGLHTSALPYSADDCLLHFETQLPDGRHNLTWHASPGLRILISRFDVIKFAGEQHEDEGSATGVSTGSHGTTHQKLSRGAIAGIAVGGAAFLVAAIGAWLVFHSRRKQARKTEDLKKQFQMTRRFSFPREKQPEI